MKLRKYLNWIHFERLLRLMEVIFIMVTALVILQVPAQIREFQNSQESRSVDFLLRLEDKLNQGTNYKVSLAIEKNSPILKNNKGRFTEDELDCYLNDLTSISDVYQRELISLQSVNDWYYKYFIKTYQNQEIQNYLKKIREEDRDYYIGLDSVAIDLINFNKN